MALDQATRHLALSTPLGENTLLLTHFEGFEAMSELFHFTLDLISDDNAILPEQIVGKNVTIVVRTREGDPRYFNGFVSRFAAMDEDENGRRNYRAEVVPWLWFLTRTSDCRIFQNKTIPQIIEQIFQDAGFKQFSMQLTGNHPEREFVVQYRESDFAFVSRLIEEEGIFYYFKHGNGKHEMVIGDHKGAYADCAQNQVDYPRDTGSRAMQPHITSWQHNYEFRTGRIAHTDYNFKTPSTSLMSSSQTTINLPDMNKFEFYDYPGAFDNKSDGSQLSDVRMEQEEAAYDVVQGASLCASFSAGAKFKIQSHRSKNEEGKGYVLTRVTHSASEMNPYEVGTGEGSSYENQFRCVPDSIAARAPTGRTRKPAVQGVQTAVVVGPPGEEIYPDEFGRVKVQFHWDREGKKDQNSSCWVRVSQAHAGKNFGGIDLPRVGDEVIVSFEEGDVNRPIITGRVYHAENMPPYPLPEKKTISGFRTKTYKGNGYNEFIMDDSPGSEMIREHAQYNKDTTVENDLTLTVHNNRTTTIDVDDTETVGNNQVVTIGVDQSNTVGANQSNSIGADRTTSVSGNDQLTVSGNRTQVVSGNRNADVTGDDTLVVGGNLAINATGDVTVNGAKITLIAGGSAIEISPSGIKIASSGIVEIQGAMIKENC